MDEINDYMAYFLIVFHGVQHHSETYNVEIMRINYYSFSGY